ncbi:MAG: GNAT family N-acetyltransferase [Oligosphaeraceae bacterium]|nr:GNAT family N-acetyltransferase [Oligosphaeraceae bacterium]
MIRPYQKSDLAIVMDIANRAWSSIRKMSRQELGDKIADLMNPYGDDKSKGEQIRRQAEEAPEQFWICEEQGKIVGFITFAVNKSAQYGEILNNAADPDCGLKGIGQQMYKAVLEHFCAEGLKYAKVHTGLDWAHAPARRAYERAGFDRKLEHVTYYKEL